MDMKTMDRKPTKQEPANTSTPETYRGFRIKKECMDTKYSKEITGYNVNGHRLIGAGETEDEAYNNLIDRIDMTLDGRI